MSCSDCHKESYIGACEQAREGHKAYLLLLEQAREEHKAYLLLLEQINQYYCDQLKLNDR